MNKSVEWWISWPLGVVAFFVLPNGPAWRLLLGAVLLLTARDLSRWSTPDA